MGFFSSRKTDDTDNFLAATAATTPSDKSVVNVIRSRFYGRNKGKEREEQPPASFTTHGSSTAQTLSNPSSAYTPVASSPLTRHASSKGAGPSILRSYNDRPLPNTPSRSTAPASMGPPPSPSPSPRPRATASAQPKASNTLHPSQRKPTDTVTMTLAQRLNELAVANSDGLLNDEEYRLLRQNLFERFASNTVVPTENPVVPVARPRPRGTGSTQEGRPVSRPLSNFQVDVNRSPSIRSKSSVTSGVTDFLRRATSRRTPSGSKDYSDTSSIFSSTSTASGIFRRGLSKKSSNSSVRTTTSRTQADTMSISSRQTGAGSNRTDRSDQPHLSPAMSRSATSIRRLATPPSSFPTRSIGSEPRYTGHVGDIFDEEHLKTAAEIRQEILTVEAEARRLMDAFNGLELTTLARVQRRQGRAPLQTTGENGKDSSWTLVPDGRSQRRVTIADGDVVSIRSATSAGTSPSVSRSAYSGVKAMSRTKGNPNASLGSKSGSLHRKNSSSSVTSQERRGGRGGGGGSVPPVPALPATYGHLGVGHGSNVSLTRSTGHLPMSVVPEDEDDMSGMGEEDGQDEMEDIRRRRDEVSVRYEARLEYLRAKLKGAQLHEKLLRK